VATVNHQNISVASEPHLGGLIKLFGKDSGNDTWTLSGDGFSNSLGVRVLTPDEISITVELNSTDGEVLDNGELVADSAPLTGGDNIIGELYRFEEVCVSAQGSCKLSIQSNGDNEAFFYAVTSGLATVKVSLLDQHGKILKSTNTDIQVVAP
jgi:hypothetical protein